ncbi:MAG: Flavobacterium phage 11b [Pseudomonadota bacterium]|jgi:hypothetical protein
MGAKRSPEIEQLVLTAIADGLSVRKACEAAGVAPSSWVDWCDADEKLGEQYAHARRRGADAEFERLQELADEPPPPTADGKLDSAWVQWKRLQIDTRKWALSKRRPEKYGDRIDVQQTTSPLLIQINLGDDDRGAMRTVAASAKHELPQLPLVTR